ncbi:MAG: YkgJ family cysteine cluster protein [Spirochaetales bacterium]|nr:YkgJ family cysteine cluster protein [Spirochaetales bacterium]
MIDKLIKPFYGDGLHFECTKCSACCRHTPGYVFLSKNDISSLLSALQLPFSRFFSEFCRIVPTISGTKISLIEKSNYDCIFWSNDGCLYYEHRPFQCRSFPFWTSYMGSRNKWKSLKSFCPGIDNGILHSGKEINRWMENVKKEDYYYSRRDFENHLMSNEVEEKG